MMEGRRTLSFSALAEVMPEVDRLLEGHSTVGRWSLGQICHHLTGAIIGSVEGARFRPPWLFRKTIGPLIVRHILKTGRFPNGAKFPSKYAPSPGLDARAEAEALRAAIRLFGMHPGPFAEPPIGGKLTREDWDRFHAIHCAHHLGFARPEGADGA